jgi:hypothetical protein
LIQIEKKEIQSCCGKKRLVWKLNCTLKKEHLSILQQAGFFFLKSFRDAGMIYIEDKGLIARGVFGLNELQVSCKSKACEESIKLLEKTILTTFDI